MNWTNVQLPLFDPIHLGNTTFDVNGPTYRVKGFELQVVARVTGRADSARVEILEQLASRRTRPA